MKRPSKNTGIPYELALQRIFQEIHDREPDRTIKVEQNVQIPGRDARHQIDLLWRFSVADIEHLTIVQARDWNQTIKQEAVFAFRQILDEIPGQPRGVIVTRRGFQRGARTYAEAHGIKLFTLREGSPGISMTDISFATFRVEACRMPGGGKGVVVRTTVFRPEPRIKLTVEPSGPLPEMLTYSPSAIQLFNAGKGPIGTLSDVLRVFVSTMEMKNQLAGIFSKQFPDPTFIRAPRSKRFFQLQSLEAEIEIVKEELPPIHGKPPGFVDFVLEDLETGKRQSFIQPSRKKGD